MDHVRYSRVLLSYGYIDAFNAANPDINVILDVVPYEAIQNTLPIQLAAGEGPDDNPSLASECSHSHKKISITIKRSATGTRK